MDIENQFEERKTQFNKILESMDEEKRLILSNLVEQFLFIEKQLMYLMQKPFIRVHPEDPSLQKPTAAAKLYKELSQIYTNQTKIILAVCKNINTDDEDPVEKFVMEFKNKYETR